MTTVTVCAECDHAVPCRHYPRMTAPFPDLSFIGRAPYASDATSQALDALRATVGWNALSITLARYLLAKKGHARARLWLESVFINMENEVKK